MTPKEKAIDLCTMFESTYITMSGCSQDSNPCIITNNMFKNSAIRCALIAVNEILSIYKKEWNIDNSYWEQVKIELEKL